MKAGFSYIVVLLSAVIYMMLFDRSAGGIMTVFLIVVPAISVFLTAAARKKLEFELSVPDDILKKNCRTQVSVNVHKNTYFPVPVISFSFNATEHFRKPDYDVYRFSMSENREVSIDINLLPEVCGLAEIGIGKVCITDYLGIFRFTVRIPDISEKICILPEIHEIDDYGEIIRSIYNTLPDNDDEKEASVVYGRAASPGYEYRNYVPGDSLRRVNWKLSSKKGQLYVRMDEASGMTLPNIILDITQNESEPGKRSGVFMLQQIIEGSLSLLSICVRNGIECNYIYPASGTMVTETVSSAGDVERISCELLKNMYSPGVITLDNENRSKSTDVHIVYTLGVTDGLAETAEASVMSGNNVKIVVPEQLYRDDDTRLSEIWLMRDDCSLYRSL